MRKKWPIIVAVLLGLAAVVLVNSYLLRVKQAYEQQFIKEVGTVEPVLVASRDIKKGTLISEAMLETASIPSRFIQPRAVWKKDAVTGKMALADIYKGEQILGSKLAERTSDAAKGATSLAAAIPKGKRAIAIEISAANAAGGMVQAGDHVDIITTFQVPRKTKGEKTTQTIAATLFQNVKVLAVKEEVAVLEEPSSISQGRPAPPPRSRALKGTIPIALALGPMEAEVLLAAMQLGEIRLVLRGEGEAVTAPLPPITPEQVLMKYLRLEGEMVSEDQVTIEIIRGNETETVTVPKQKTQQGQ